MFQPSVNKAEEQTSAESESDDDEDTCPHCGRGGILADAMAMEGADDAGEADEELPPEKKKASFIEALRKARR